MRWPRFATIPEGTEILAYALQSANFSADRQEMLWVWSRALTHASAERFSWIYERNPAGPVSSWVVRDSSRQVAGAASVFPRELQMGNTRVRAGIAGDLAVRRDHRVLGPAVMLQRATLDACDSGRFDIVYGFPNANAEAVERRAGYRVLGPVSRMRRHLRCKAALSRRMAAPLAAMIGPCLDLTARTLGGEDRVGRKYSFRLEAKFDERVDRLWTRLCGTLPITGVRGAEYLNWRFVSCPHKPYRVMAMYGERGDELLGYAVYYVRERESVLCDLLAVNFGRELDALIAGFLRHQHELPVDSVCCRYFGTRRLTKALRRFGFRERREGSVLFHIPSASPLAQADLAQENWYLLDGDADL